MNGENNWKPSSVTLNFFIAILTIISLFFAFFEDNQMKFTKEQLPSVIYIIIGALVIAMLINYKRINREINKLKSTIYFFLNIVIEYRRGYLEFLDTYGEKAMYNEESLFKRIRRKGVYSSNIEVDGCIDYEIHTYNCFNSLNHKKNIITITYGRKKENKDIIHNKRQLQFGFVVTALDSFPAKEEFWDTVFKHYTKVYDMKFSFFKENPPKDVDIYEVTYDKQGNEKLKRLSVDPLIMQKYDRIVMKVKLLHVKKGKRIRVTWNWNKKKKKKALKK